MRLMLLSSHALGEHGSRLRDLVGDGTRAGLIFNALDQYDTRLRRLPLETAQLVELGLEREELNLRDHFGDQEGLRDRLDDLDLVWVLGGNAFVLARAMALSGFRAASMPALDDGRLTYAGYSVGACVTGPDLRGLHLMDDDAVVPEGYAADSPTEALGWVPWRIVPHWTDDGSEPAATAAAECLRREGVPFRKLRDGESIVVEGDPDRTGA